MNKGDRNFDAGNELDQYYLEMKELLPLYGWPTWPPKEVPKQTEWYKEEIRVLPKKPHLLQTCFIGFDGTPHAGKTTLSEALKNKYDQSLVHRLKILNPDDLYVQGEGGVMHVNMSLIYPTLEDPMPLIMEKNDWVTNLWHQFNKQLFWESRIQELIRMNNTNATNLIIGQRSPIDQTIFSAAFVTTTDPIFSIPQDFKVFATDRYLKTLIGSQALAQFIDAEILIGTDKPEARKRRKDMGFTSKGIADSSFFDDLSAWNGYWIKNIWPNLYDLHGTGLLVLDGTNKIEENLQILKSYVEETKKICLQQ
jgi:hypothetical protein